MQFNPPNKTIEGEIFESFVKAGAISRDNSNDLKKNGFMRAARTDKGVHAAGNLISLKMIIEDPDICQKINAELPEQIRLWGFERTNKSFDCRKMCSSRVYEYLMPTFCFLPPKPSSSMGLQIEEAKVKHPGVTREDAEGEKWWQEMADKLKSEGISASQIEAAQQAIEAGQQSPDDPQYAMIKVIKRLENEQRRAYRISSDRLSLVREVLKLYEGHHNFHNFTLGKDFKDPSAARFMKELSVSDPFVIEGTEWVSVKIHGQSFMLHQIRKMIAMATMVVRTGCPLHRINEAFLQTKINIPKAPALGLLLEAPVYEGYNARLSSFGYNAIDFSKYEKEMDAFKMKYIYDKIYAEEVRDNVFHGFFGFIDGFNGGPVFSFFTANGIVEGNDAASLREIEVPNQKEESNLVD